MKKVNKVLTSLAAGAMAVSPATSIIHATEASPNSSSKVEASQKKEKKDVVLEALKENDAEKAEKLANTHILNVMENLHLNQEQD